MFEIDSHYLEKFPKETAVNHLLTMLESHPLDASFEDFGNFIQYDMQFDDPKITEKYKGCVQFFGNFFHIALGFTIRTDEKKIINKLESAIRENQKRLDYQDQWKIRLICVKLNRYINDSSEKEIEIYRRSHNRKIYKWSKHRQKLLDKLVKNGIMSIKSDNYNYGTTYKIELNRESENYIESFPNNPDLVRFFELIVNPV